MKDDTETIDVQLSGDDSIKLATAIQKGKMLAKYDLCCAVATDSLFAKIKDIDTNRYQYYLCDNYEDSPIVYFGKYLKGTFEIWYKATFSGSKPSIEILQSPVHIEKMSNLAKALNIAIDTNKTLLDQRRLPYNFWTLMFSDSILVYSSPGYTNNTIFMCGGIKTTFSPTGKGSLKLYTCI